jgi:hypothetical protein
VTRVVLRLLPESLSSDDMEEICDSLKTSYRAGAQAFIVDAKSLQYLELAAATRLCVTGRWLWRHRAPLLVVGLSRVLGAHHGADTLRRSLPTLPSMAAAEALISVQYEIGEPSELRIPVGRPSRRRAA